MTHNIMPFIPMTGEEREFILSIRQTPLTALSRQALIMLAQERLEAIIRQLAQVCA